MGDNSANLWYDGAVQDAESMALLLKSGRTSMEDKAQYIRQNDLKIFVDEEA